MKFNHIFSTIVLTIALISVGCKKEEVQDPTGAKTGSLRVMAPSLLGKWTFVAYKKDQNAVSLRAANKAYIVFAQQNATTYTISGRSVVNMFSMTVTDVDANNPNSSLKVNQGVTTLIGSTAEDMTAEQTFLTRLMMAKDASLLNEKLTLNLTDGEAMIFQYTP